jgi:glucose/arabinose dehydrogenase
MRKLQSCATTVRRLTATAAALLVLGVPHAHRAVAGTPATGFTDTSVVSGLSEPTALAFLPDGRMLVTEKGGALQLVTGGVATPAGTVPVCTASEMGLLGVAVHPDFVANGIVYLYRSSSANGCGSSTGRYNEVVRTVLTNGTIGALTPLVTGIRTDGGNHDGGVLRIGPDRKLYVGVGDTGVGDGGNPGDSTNPYAQDLNELNGKVLRIGLDGSIPSDNPFYGQSGKRGEIYAYGFRNPFRMGFDPISNRLWVGDVGQSTREEIDRVTAGGNHSWPYCEGALPAACTHVGDVVPVYDYDHNGGSASITGGAFGVGGGLYGTYYFGDYVLSTIWQATVNAGRDAFTAAPTPVITNAGGPVDIVFGPDGALYYVAIADGEVRRVGNADFGPPPTTTTTSTTSSTSTTTTTSLPAGVCVAEPTFGCAAAALDGLLNDVGDLGDLGTLDDALRAKLTKARAALDVGRRAGGSSRSVRASLRKAINALAAFRTQLRSPRGRRLIGGPTRRALAASATDGIAALRALRRTL